MVGEELNQLTEEFYQKKIKTYPARSNQASGLAWPVRHLVLKRIGWEYAKPVSSSTQRRFQRGIETEKVALAMLGDLPGVEVRGTGLPVEHKPAEIAGRIDALISLNGRAYPLEIKSLQYFNRYHNARDFLSDSLFSRNYYAQLNTYLFCSNYEVGLFLLIDPTSYDTRFIEMELDLDAAEETLQKCEEVNKYVHQWDGKSFLPENVNELPDCEECSSYCQFQSLCGRVDGKAEVTQDLAGQFDRIDFLAKRRGELEETAKEYESVKGELRSIVSGHETVITGNYLIQGKEVKTTIYRVPKEVKGQYAESSSYWKTGKIIALGGTNG